jgi:hypothetical protein
MWVVIGFGENVWRYCASLVACQRGMVPNPKELEPAESSSSKQTEQHRANSAIFASNPGRGSIYSEHEQKTDSKPSSYPWGELLAPANIPNWLLVGVGSWAGFLALKCLKDIKRQADLMKLQLAEMQRQTDWLVSKERPVLTIKLDPFDFFQPRSEAGPYFVTGTVHIHGLSDVTIKKGRNWISTDLATTEDLFP